MWSWISDPFGDSTPDEDPDGDGRTFTLNLRYPGQFFDAETGASYNYFRHYDPTTGRYTTSDPIGLEGGLNPYLYAYANPIAFMDPTGLIVPGAASGPPGAALPNPNPRGGRFGTFGCAPGLCASYKQGDQRAQASFSPTFGGGLMFCSKPPKEDCAGQNDDAPLGGSVSPSSKAFGGGAIFGLQFNPDGTVCVLVGLFAGFSVSPEIPLGDIPIFRANGAGSQFNNRGLPQ